MRIKYAARLTIWTILIALLLATACAPMPASEETGGATQAPNPTEPPLEPSSQDDEESVIVAPTSSPEPPKAAVVNGQPIYLEDYERQLSQMEAALEAQIVAQDIDPNSAEGQEMLAQMIAQQSEWSLNMMIEQALTEQAAEAAGVVISDEEVNAYLQEMIEENGGEEAFQAKLAALGQTKENAWEETRQQLLGMKMIEYVLDNIPATAEHVHARHIYVDTREEAERILMQLQASADFAALSKAHSQDESTREYGGDLGFFPRGILVVPQVEEAAFALQPGQFSGVIEGPNGYHIVQVIDRDPAREISPDNMRFLRDQAIQRWIEDLWKEAEIQYFVETGQ
jgi:parvulin-like peptidyl-prolyl isomerase